MRAEGPEVDLLPHRRVPRRRQGLSPVLKKLKKESFEALLLEDPIDELTITQLKEFNGHKLVCKSKGGIELEETKEEARKAQVAAFKDLCKVVKDALGDKIEKVVVLPDLVNTPCVLITAQFGWSANEERIVKAQALLYSSMSPYMASEKMLKLNPNSAIIKVLKNKVSEDKADKSVRDLTYLLYEATSSLVLGR